jgi:hypothetical protein
MTDSQTELDLVGKPAGRGREARLTIISGPSPLVASEVYETYWKFAAERQAIFFRRASGCPAPWTDDRILQQHKFTNAYRASDRVSQYLIRHVIYDGDQAASEVFFRIILFKLFNKIETWDLLKNALEDVRWETYDFNLYDRVLTNAIEAGQRIYSAAYIMPSAGSFGHARKHRNHLKLIEMLMRDQVYDRLQETWSMEAGYNLLRSYPTLGNFLAYQLITDVNYSELTNYSEMEFVVPGPGALDGIRKCFSDLGGRSESDVIRIMADLQSTEFVRLGLNFEPLWGRALQLIDCQNLFCEVDKYARVAHPSVAGLTGRTRIKQKYRVTSTPIQYWYPPKWGLNATIAHTPHETHDSRI